jgi:hypothetical protein
MAINPVDRVELLRMAYKALYSRTCLICGDNKPGAYFCQKHTMELVKKHTEIESRAGGRFCDIAYSVGELIHDKINENKKCACGAINNHVDGINCGR